MRATVRPIRMLIARDNRWPRGFRASIPAKPRVGVPITEAAVALWLIAFAVSVPAQADQWSFARTQMVEAIRADVHQTRRLIDRTALNPRVMSAMGEVPRHRFVPKHLANVAYENRPLPIGHGQTISQPYIVALMTDLLAVDHDSRVLEVGTGSGYQAAVLAGLVSDVFTVEIIEPLAESVKQRFMDLGYANVHSRQGDGYYGWEDEAPFDAIIVTAAASHVPPPLISQLRPGGRMVIPVGTRFNVQQLLLIEKTDDGALRSRQVLPVRFVPLTGDH